MRLSGKVAAITGAGGGIGGAIAEAFAREAAALCIVDLDAGQANDTLARLGDEAAPAIAQPLDVTDQSAAAAVFLASADAAYITGDTLNVDGGFSAAGMLFDLASLSAHDKTSPGAPSPGGFPGDEA